MLDQLRGRNLAHVGCTLGLLIGLVLGLVAATAILALVASTSAVGWAVVVWIGATVGLGALGYVIGGRSSRLWGADHSPDEYSSP
jgi:hypothetical protein